MAYPRNPTVGQLYTNSSDRTFQWNGFGWLPYRPDALAGDALASVPSGLNLLPYFTNVGRAKTTPFSPYAREVLAGEGPDEWLTLLGLPPEGNVQEQDDDLDALSALSGTGIARRVSTTPTWSVGDAIVASEIGNDQVTFAKVQNVATASILGRLDSGTGDIQALTGTQATTLLDEATTSLKGLFSGTDKAKLDSIASGATNYTDEKAQDAIGGILVDSATIDFVYDDGAPSITATVINDSISDAKLRNSAALSVIGRAANSTGDPADIVAGANDRLLVRTGDALSFAQLTSGMFPSTLLDTDAAMAADSDTRIASQKATRAYVATAVAGLVDSAPGVLDTLNELAAALGDDANFATTVATALALKAPLASPSLTGVPVAPTATLGTNTTQLATTEFVQSAIGALVDGAPSGLNTLNELAAAIGDDASFSTTVTSALAGKVAKVGDTMTGELISLLGGAGGSVLRVDTNEMGSADFALNLTRVAGENGATRNNNVLAFGYNVGPSGKQVSGDHQFVHKIESTYTTVASIEQLEMYYDYINAANSVNVRPFSITINLDTDAIVIANRAQNSYFGHPDTGNDWLNIASDETTGEMLLTGDSYIGFNGTSEVFLKAAGNDLLGAQTGRADIASGYLTAYLFKDARWVDETLTLFFGEGASGVNERGIRLHTNGRFQMQSGTDDWRDMLLPPSYWLDGGETKVGIGPTTFTPDGDATLHVFDNTDTTGATQLRVQLGDGQGARKPLLIVDNDGDDLAYVTVNGNAFFNNLDVADAPETRVNLGLVIGTDVQAYDATLAGIAATNPAANQMLYATDTNTFAVTAVGTTGLNLLDDAAPADARATIGMQSYGFRANKGGTHQTGVVSNTPTKLTFGTEVFDTGAGFDHATDYRWTPPAGTVVLQAAFAASGVGTSCNCAIYKNGSEIGRAGDFASGGLGLCFVMLIDTANGTDYYEAYIIGDSGGTITVFGTATLTYFSGAWISA